MTLSALMKKGWLCAAATAIPATAATEEGEKAGTVARVATVAVANPPSTKSALTAPMTADEESAIRAWLVHIEESDVVVIGAVLDQCRTDVDVRRYFILRAAEVPRSVAFDDDRRCCEQCANLTSAGKCGASQAVSGRRGYEPVHDILRRCEEYVPGPNDQDKRHGRERWPGLMEKEGNHENN